MKKNTLIKASSLLTILFFNTGCFFGLLGGDPKPETTTTTTNIGATTATTLPTTTIVSVSEPYEQGNAPRTYQQQSSYQQPTYQHSTYQQPTYQEQRVPAQPQLSKTYSMPTTSAAPMVSRVSARPVSSDATAIVPECTDDPSVTSPCNKGLIKPEEISPSASENDSYRLKSYQGQTLTIGTRSNGYTFPEYNDKIIVLEMFGKTCPHCIKEMPILNRIQRKYRNNVQVVAMQVEKKMSKREANSLIRRHNIKYPVLSGDSAKNLQYHIQNTFGWTGVLPFTMVIKDGVTEFTYKGEVSYNEINRDIKSILN